MFSRRRSRRRTQWIRCQAFGTGFNPASNTNTFTSLISQADFAEFADNEATLLRVVGDIQWQFTNTAAAASQNAVAGLGLIMLQENPAGGTVPSFSWIAGGGIASEYSWLQQRLLLIPGMRANSQDFYFGPQAGNTIAGSNAVGPITPPYPFWDIKVRRRLKAGFMPFISFDLTGVPATTTSTWFINLRALISRK